MTHVMGLLYEKEPMNVWFAYCGCGWWSGWRYDIRDSIAEWQDHVAAAIVGEVDDDA